MRDFFVKSLVFVCAALVCAANADLTISGPRCGVFTCKPHEFCSSFENQCKGCADICDKDSHNFEEKLCVETCQGYLHDIRYVRVGQSTDNRVAISNQPYNNNNSKDIDKLYTLVTVALVLIILLILAIVGYAGYKCHKWAKKNDIKPNNIISYFKRENNNEDVEKGSPNGLSTASTATPRQDQKNLRLDITNTMSGSEQPTTPATMTTSISRRPAEDSALDYAYDNHAMAGTPSPHTGKTARESNF